MFRSSYGRHGVECFSSRGDLALGEARLRSQEEPTLRHQPSESVPPVRIHDSLELNKTCCVDGAGCMLASFCARATPSADGTVSVTGTETRGSVLREARLPWRVPCVNNGAAGVAAPLALSYRVTTAT